MHGYKLFTHHLRNCFQQCMFETGGEREQDNPARPMERENRDDEDYEEMRIASQSPLIKIALQKAHQPRIRTAA